MSFAATQPFEHRFDVPIGLNQFFEEIGGKIEAGVSGKNRNLVARSGLLDHFS
jgi:hypothetical protein